MVLVRYSILNVVAAVVVLLSAQVGPVAVAKIVNEKARSGSRQKRQFRGGTTLNLTFKSKMDSRAQPLLLRIPKDYAREKSWPLLVTLHGLGDGPLLAPNMDSMVQIGPYGRRSAWSTDASRQDVFQAIELAKQLLNIDEERIYLCGFSMGAITTFDLGLRYPDRWAACVPICGRCDDLLLIENARHLPFWIYAGGKDTVLSPEHSRKAYCRVRQLGFIHWKYTESQGVGHSFQTDWKELEKWLLSKKRVIDPNVVSFCTQDLRANSAYWVEITEPDKRADKARISAAISGQTITVTTENITNYRLNLNENLINCDEPVTIIENGTIIFSGLMDSNGSFVRPGVQVSHSCNVK